MPDKQPWTEEMSFSQSIRTELIKQIPKKLTERQATIAGFVCTCKPDKDIPFATSITLTKDRAEYLCNLLTLVGTQYKRTRIPNSESRNVRISDASRDDFINCYSMCFMSNSADQLSSSMEFCRNFLKATFINCGYFSDPNKTYRIELHIQNPRAVDLVVWMLHACDIEPSISLKGETTIIRFRDGESVSNFLAIIGSVKGYLEFENVRAEHEVTSRVQRSVNCDMGNAKRKAEAGARRTELFVKLLASEEAASLPKELHEAAMVHINNPGASIAELGKLMDPPIGKSGMNHRLIKLEEIAKGIKD